jgi:hypothetical protein
MAYTHTVLGIFDSDYDANDAADLLMDKGFNRSDIEIRNRTDVDAITDEEELAGRLQHTESGLTAFFTTIFGNKKEDADKHYRVASKSGAVLTVYTNSEAEATLAADILDEKGAIDVNERTDNASASYNLPGAKDYSQLKNSRVYDAPVIAPGDHSYAALRNADRQTDKDFGERPGVEERSGPGVGATPTSGQRSKSRINQWQGEASARLREDRDTETKTGW